MFKRFPVINKRILCKSQSGFTKSKVFVSSVALRRSVMTLTALLILLTFMGCEKSQPSSDTKSFIHIDTSARNNAPIVDKIGIPYPRLAMWWLNAYEESASAIAKYDLLLNEFDDPYLYDKLEAIRKINPSQLLLRPISPSEHLLFVDGSEETPNPAIADLPTSFFLLHQGAKLVSSVDEKTTVLTVDRLTDDEGNPLFYTGDDIAIGAYESAKITSIDTALRTLEVKRGYVRKASIHATGENVNAHVRFWPNSWVMNITSACPELAVKGVETPVDYITYFHLLIQNKVEGLYPSKTDNPYFINQVKVNYDGFVLDRFEDHQSWLKWGDAQPRDLDPYQNQTVLTDEEVDALVMKTVDQFTSLLKQTYGDVIVIRNNPLTLRAESHDGQVYESAGWDEPTTSWWRNLFVTSNKAPDDYVALSYLEWFNVKQSPIVFMEVYEDEKGADSDGDGVYRNPLDTKGYKLDERKMRFSLASTLMGDGFYSYEVNTNGHGSLGLLWFETYDLGIDQKGYLGFPTGEAYEVSENVFVRPFEKGIVVVNASSLPIVPSFSTKVKQSAGFELGEDGTLDAYDGCVYLYL